LRGKLQQQEKNKRWRREKGARRERKFTEESEEKDRDSNYARHLFGAPAMKTKPKHK
jgi:hypothetical protein